MSELRLTRAQLETALGSNHDTIVQIEKLLYLASVLTPEAVDALVFSSSLVRANTAVQPTELALDRVDSQSIIAMNVFGARPDNRVLFQADSQPIIASRVFGP